MAIETTCQNCQKTLRVADEHAGKQARCPACGTIYKVPSAAPAQAPLPSATMPSAPAVQPKNPFDDLAPSGPIASPSNPPSWSSRSFANPPAKETAPERWSMKIDDGREFGPVDRQTLDQWYAERRIGATTQLRREGDTNWQPARNVYPQLGAATMTPASNSANPFAEQPQQQYGYGQPAYGAPAGYPGRTYGEPHRGGVIIALALVSWVTGCFFLGIAAWIMGASDLKQMRAGTMDRSGEGLTQAGMIIGAIHTVLGILFIGFFFLMMIAAIAAGH
jgi:hypothetical protein